MLCPTQLLLLFHCGGAGRCHVVILLRRAAGGADRADQLSVDHDRHAAARCDDVAQGQEGLIALVRESARLSAFAGLGQRAATNGKTCSMS